MGFILEFYALDHAALAQAIRDSGTADPAELVRLAMSSAASAEGIAAAASRLNTNLAANPEGPDPLVLDKDEAGAVRAIIRRDGIRLGDLSHSSAATPGFFEYLGDRSLALVDGRNLTDALLSGPVAGMTADSEADADFGGLPRNALRPLIETLGRWDPQGPDGSGWNAQLLDMLEDCDEISQRDLVSIYG
jgi:hypothetical protein